MKNIKRVLIIGILMLISSFWGLALIIFNALNLPPSWATPPGRFITGLMLNGMLIPFIIFSIILAMGFVLLIIEYFKKE